MSFDSSAIWQVTRLWRNPSSGIGSESCKPAFLPETMLSAVDASLRAQRLLWTSPSQFETAEFRFYGALSHAASWDSASPDQRQQHFEALTAHHRQLEIWAEHCPENFENRAALVGAEIARIEGRELDAEHLYEQAIRSAHANGFVHNEALANELAARFYAARGFEKIANTYLRDARYCYLRWGADGKVRQLDRAVSATQGGKASCRSDKHDRGARRTPGSRDGHQSLAGRVGRDRSGKTDRHAHAHGDRARGR